MSLEDLDLQYQGGPQDALARRLAPLLHEHEQEYVRLQGRGNGIQGVLRETV